uniref:Uncharacterized protein n=1 Tax=Tanacetum cinerariifolium TaxID=118510 RepID=A0A699JZZ3_TANCI|nr:hypothetical protein [Tanacetum cinerariifolium]
MQTNARLGGGHGNGGVVTVVEAVMGWLWWWREGVAKTQIVTRCGRDEEGVEMVTMEMAWCGSGSCLDGRRWPEMGERRLKL